MTKRGVCSFQVCSAAFVALGRAQAAALGCPELPIVEVPHPFGALSRGKIREAAEQCVEDIAKLVAKAPSPVKPSMADRTDSSEAIEIANDIEAINQLARERRWTDGLPIVPPTVDRVERMLRATSHDARKVVATVAPAYGPATVERIAVNATMAGCDPGCLPVLIAAVKAMAESRFNLQGIQTTTNPATVWLIVNGPIAVRLGMNASVNCLGPGNWANATLGRALRLIMQNIGGALSGEMDRATLGQPGKFIFCCAENEKDSPWEPLHVQKGLSPLQDAVTVVGAEGTLNLNTHCKNAEEVLRVFAETLARPSCNDYYLCGEPWLIISPETACLLKEQGLSKSDVKRRLWDQSKLRAGRMTDADLKLTAIRRAGELGAISGETMLPICSSPDSIGILVCGGAGTHSMYIPSFGNTRSVTRVID